MPPKATQLAIALVLMLSTTTTLAQELTLPQHQLYTLNHGLPQTQVTRLMQDSRGYIWVGTKLGFARYNGDTFTAFPPNEQHQITFVQNIHEDTTGRIWVVGGNGIALVSGDSISYYPSSSSVGSSCCTPSGDTLWLGCNWAEHYQLMRFTVANQKWQSYTLLAYGFAYSPRHGCAIAVATDGWLYSLPNGTPKRIAPLPEGFLPNSYQLIPLDEGRQLMLIAMKDANWENVSYFRLDDGCFTPVSNFQRGRWQPAVPDSLKPKSSIANTTAASSLLRGAVIAPQGYSVTSGLVDADGNTWYGTEQGVLRMYSGAFTHFSTAILPEVWGTVEQPRGKMWLASHGFGLSTLQGGVSRRVNLNNDDGFYFKPSVGGQGEVYFAKNNEVLCALPNGTFKQMKLAVKNTTSFCTHYDHQRDILLAGSRYYVQAWSRQQPIRTIDSCGNVRIAGNVMCIAQDSSGYHWFTGKNTYRYSWESNTLKQYRNERSLDVCTDHTGRTWFATFNGLSYYSAQLDSIVRLDAPDIRGLVALVLPIDTGRLLLSQMHGLYILNLTEFNRTGRVELSLYNRSNGYLSEEPGQAGAYKDSQGMIWITSSSSLCRMNPSLLPKISNQHTNLVFATCNNKPIMYGQHEVHLPRNQNSATITFDAIGLNRPLPVQYSYKLGANGEWSKLQRESYAVLTNLPHGRSTLYVRVLFPGLLENTLDTTYTLDIVVRKAFYNQAWFTPLIIALLLATIATVLLAGIRTRINLRNTEMRAASNEIESINAQLNPHFVYNVLTSIQTRIRGANIADAENYLVKMAHLMRNFLHSNRLNSEHSDSLTSELNRLQDFIDFQQLLYPKAFVYHLSIGKEVDTDTVKVPTMLLQPFVENAISHGLIPLQRTGTLHIDISSNTTTQRTTITIADNGVGMEHASNAQMASPSRYPSMGRKLSLRRVELLKQLGIFIEVQTSTSNQGTTITITI